MPLSHDEDWKCPEVQEVLSEYVDGTLSARSVWQVEKHLADCGGCTDIAHQLQKTVDLLRSAEKYDTADGFMARLHARLDSVDAEATTSRSPLAGGRDWVAWIRASMAPRRVRALSVGLACVAAAAALFVLREGPGSMPPTGGPIASAQTDLSRHVAMTASNPFDDPVAAKLEADDRSSSDSTL